MIYYHKLDYKLIIYSIAYTLVDNMWRRIIIERELYLLSEVTLGRSELVKLTKLDQHDIPHTPTRHQFEDQSMCYGKPLQGTQHMLVKPIWLAQWTCLVYPTSKLHKETHQVLAHGECLPTTWPNKDLKNELTLHRQLEEFIHRRDYVMATPPLHHIPAHVWSRLD